MMYSKICASPIGDLMIEADETGICAVRTAGEGECASAQSAPVLEEAARQLEAYFSDVRKTFHLPLAPKGTPFELEVWRRLCAIPCGETRTYGQIAGEIGRPQASRAVGRACGRNPLLIIVPCHRVVGAGGRLTGFAAGMDAKRYLLAIEGHRIDKDRMMKA